MRARSKTSLAVAVAAAALVVFLLPAFVAFRYTAPEQRGGFLTRPWRGWSFAYAALAVPADSQLKTSGAALRKAEWLFEGTVVEPDEVQLLYVPAGEPYTVEHQIGGRTVASTVTPTYRFIWQVEGTIAGMGEDGVVVALLDYQTGHLLYDVRDDLRPGEVRPAPDDASPAPAP
jgi:hypothetical protein